MVPRMDISILLLVGVSLLAMFTYPCLKWFGQSTISGVSDFDLAVGILSSRDHFELREIIRKTWLHDSNVKNNTIVRFVIGRDSCSIHPSNRIDEYGCEQRSLAVPIQGETTVPILSVRKGILSVSTKRMFSDVFIFRVLHPVAVRRLGLLFGVDIEKRVTVGLYECSRDNALVSVVFSPIDPGVAVSGFHYQPIETVILPKGFEGFIKIVEDYKITEGYSAQTMDLLGGVIRELKQREHCFREKDFQLKTSMSDTQTYLVSMAVSLHETEALRLDLEVEQNRDQEWQIQQEVISERLLSEASSHGDIVFVNTVDVYRNLANKLLMFHEWVSRNINAKFIMKTDDDCYVDIGKVLSGLHQFPPSRQEQKLWWGHFRNNWFVEVEGKWVEPQYTSSVYPRFACGSGNVISQDLSYWLAENAAVLNTYQGEDVSMGIWMAALSPLFVHDERWSCDQSCRADAIVIPELDVEKMELAWKNRMSCSNPCTCVEE